MKTITKNNDLNLFKIDEGYGSFYIVKQYVLFTGWIFLAEFTYRSDALLFIRTKKLLMKMKDFK